MSLFDYDPYARGCASRQLLDRIGDRWTVLLISTLEDGPHRFSELSRRVDGISQKMLTQTLRALEADGLVRRRPHDTDGRQVLVVLTDAGRAKVLADRDRRDAWLARRLDALAPDERELLARATVLLHRLTDDD